LSLGGTSLQWHDIRLGDAEHQRDSSSTGIDFLAFLH
jgi:hypothetical protein